LAALEEAFNVPVIEAYGMTEAAHQMCSNPLPPGVRKAGSVGPAAGPEVAILDERGNLAGLGETGEVVVRGTNVMRRYENNPWANAAAFAGEWFRTGDLGRSDQDGYLFLVGRIKELINRGGEKISPREVDEALLEHPAVAQAISFAVPHPRLGEDAAAAVVLRDGSPVTAQQLRSYALSRLAPHKVPSQLIIVDEIPKGPTGKPQRVGLYDKLASRLRAEFVAPRDCLEDTLAEIWGGVLGLSPVGVAGNFFALGGDSLLATQVVARIRAQLGVELPVTLLFREPTIAALAQLIREAQAEAEQIERARLLAEIESLSEENAQRLLADELHERDDLATG
jgi:acyl carrier protein